MNNDVEVPTGFLAILRAGLRVRPDIALADSDEDVMLPPVVADPIGRMTGHAFLLRGETGLRADPHFVWWAGDDDLQAEAWQRGRTVRVGGIRTNHLEADLARRRSPELTATSMADWDRFAAKWGTTPG